MEMTRTFRDRGLASDLVAASHATCEGGAMSKAEPARGVPTVCARPGRGADRRRGAAALLRAVTHGVSVAREPWVARQRFEDELRSITNARSIAVCEEDAVRSGGDVMCFEVPGVHGDVSARIEAEFDAGRRLDGWTCQLLESATYLVALLMEVERAYGRHALFARTRADGAMPLIGSSQAIREVRERIERVA